MNYISNAMRTMATSTHGREEREVNDFYATEPYAVEILLEQEKFNKDIWECASGHNHITKVLEDNEYDVWSTDIIDRGHQDEIIDFLEYDGEWSGDIITNPPYKLGKEFVEKALDVVQEGNKVAMFTKLLFLESKKRKQMFIDNPPKTIYVSSSRLICARGGDFAKYTSSAVAYIWIVWEKGYKGETVVTWIN